MNFKKYKMKISKKIALVLFICATILTGCSSDDKDETVVETETLKSFKNITFSLDYSEGFDAGRFFSTATGKSYKKNQIDASVLSKVDIAFYGTAINSFAYFLSPNDTEDGIAGATNTDYVNYVTDEFTVEQFNNLKKGEDLTNLNITDDGKSFSTDQLPRIILFKNAAGKKGAIYVKSVHKVGYDPRIVVDIKVQK